MIGFFASNGRDCASRKMKQIRLGGMGRLSAIGLVWMAVTASALAAAYLPTVGPAALRFVEPSPPSVLAMLPPLQMRDPEPPKALEPATNTTPHVAKSAPATSAAKPASPVSPPAALLEPDLLEPAGTNLPVATVERTNSPAIVLPQMLQQFLSRPVGTNPGVTILTPIEFVPPVPTAPVSSRATYQSK